MAANKTGPGSALITSLEACSAIDVHFPTDSTPVRWRRAPTVRGHFSVLLCFMTDAYAAAFAGIRPTLMLPASKCFVVSVFPIHSFICGCI